MADFNIRTDAVDVEQIMRQIRARIESKRGVDYTEQQIQELASVKLERFLDPKGVRSDLVEQFRRVRDTKLEAFQLDQELRTGFDAEMLYGTHRGILRAIRRLLNPLLKLFFNPNTVIHAIHKQSGVNALFEAQVQFLRHKTQQRDEVDVLYYELVHNLVLELTRVGIENRNLKMRLESLSSRMDFDERRARALETVVQFRPGTGPSREPQQARPRPPQDERPPQQQQRPAPPPAPDDPAEAPGGQTDPAASTSLSASPAAASPPGDAASESNTARRRRRRRRGRRGGRSRTPGEALAAGGAAEPGSPEDSPTPPHGDPTGDAAMDEGADADFDDGSSEDGPDRDDSGDEPESFSAVKLAVVVQRYGADINGGAELHARYVAEHLSQHADVDVLTTCARDYVTWRDDYQPGTEKVNGVPVRRFRVDHARDPHLFGRWSERVFNHRHSHLDEMKWLDAEGPKSSSLMRYLRSADARYEYVFFFSYRYYHCYHGAKALPSRAILVPTAERDEAIGLALSPRVFRGVRALMYNSPEEKRLIQTVSNNQHVPSVVVGIGSEIPLQPQADRFRQKYGITGRFALYVGRIDSNKGCNELFKFFLTAMPAVPKGLQLVLIGKEMLKIPDHPHIRHLGFLDDQDKFDALAAADLLVMPSYYESLSMVALEAWALGKPVLANGKCEVLRGQCIRSQAGLYYETQAEFTETLRAISESRGLNAAFSANGRRFFQQHYAWPVIEQKYLDILARLKEDDARGASHAGMDPEPGFFAKRRKVLRPANDVLAELPFGPVLN